MWRLLEDCEKGKGIAIPGCCCSFLRQMSLFFFHGMRTENGLNGYGWMGWKRVTTRRGIVCWVGGFFAIHILKWECYGFLLVQTPSNIGGVGLIASRAWQ